MSQATEMKEALMRQAQQALANGDIGAAEKAIMNRRGVAETEKLEEERAKAAEDIAALRRAAGAERWKFWVTVLAPLITALALIATIFEQGRQFSANMQIQNENTRIQNENSRLQRESKEDEQYREALKTIQKTDVLFGLTGIPLLKSFLDSPRYRAQAREVAVGVLPGIRRQDLFESWFNAIVARTDWTNFGDLVRVNAGLEQEHYRVRDYMEVLKKTPAAQRPSPTYGYGPPSDADKPPAIAPRMSLEEAKLVQAAIDTHQGITTTAISRFLRKPRPQGVSIDLTGANLWQADLSGVDLSGAILTGTSLNGVDLRNANLTGIAEFDGTGWEGTAWWRAKAIAPDLLKALEKCCRFDPKKSYQNDATKTSGEYEKELRRLRTQV